MKPTPKRLTVHVSLVDADTDELITEADIGEIQILTKAALGEFFAAVSAQFKDPNPDG